MLLYGIPSSFLCIITMSPRHIGTVFLHKFDNSIVANLYIKCK